MEMEATSEVEVDELRDALAALESARDRLAHELEVSEGALLEHYVMLEDARQLAATLEAEQKLLVREATHRRLESEIRRKLLTDVTAARAWQRGKPLARAVRVERLLTGG